MVVLSGVDGLWQKNNLVFVKLVPGGGQFCEGGIIDLLYASILVWSSQGYLTSR